MNSEEVERGEQADNNNTAWDLKQLKRRGDGNEGRAKGENLRFAPLTAEETRLNSNFWATRLKIAPLN